MGLKYDGYAMSRDAMSFVYECKTNPTMKGMISRINDAAMAKAWRKMKDLPAAEDGLSLSDLFRSFDNHSDHKLGLILQLRDFLNKQAKDNLNLARAYKAKDTTNL